MENKWGRIPVSGPWITEKEISYVADAAENAWYSNANIYNSKFESEFAKYIGVKHAIALPSCTSALHLSLLAAGIGSGDEVIVPEITWIASAAPISYVGAVPVFCDINRETWCISLTSFLESITERTKGVILVDLYGNMPSEIDAIVEEAHKRGIFVIEDAAEAIGSEFKGRKSGSFGNTGTFSFHGSKTMTTGEGGMLVTDDTGIYERCCFLRDHGRKPGDVMFNNQEIAYKYKMSSMQAALGLAQLERIDELIDRKREIFNWYQEGLKDTEGITLNSEPEDTKNTYWMVSVILDEKLGIEKNSLAEKLKACDIDTRPFFNPLSSLPAYQHIHGVDIYKKKNRTSYELAPYALNLPSGLNLNEEIVDYICYNVKKILTL
jgi:perosamine synthetase